MLCIAKRDSLVRLQGLEDVQTHSNGHRFEITTGCRHRAGRPHRKQSAQLKPFVFRWRAGAVTDWVNMCVVAESFSVARTSLGKQQSQ